MKALLSNRELTSFFDQLSMILRSGISALEGISIMKEDMEASEGQEILTAIYDHLELTGCLYESIKETGLFPDYAVNMIEIGEKAGRLDEVTSSLRDHYERESNMMNALKGAVTYPLMMLGMMTVVLLVLIIKVMPVFEQVFEQFGGSMTGFSAVILNMGKIIKSYSILFIIVAFFLIFSILFLSKQEKGKHRFLTFLQKFGPTRKLEEKIACARFADGMSLALQSGLDTEESLAMIARLTDHPDIQKKIETIREKLSEGTDFSEAFSASGIFTGLYSKMAAIGYRTGSLDEVMQRIALQCEEEVNDEIQKKIELIEPTLVAVLSILVGLILLSVMLPLIGIMSNIG